MNMQTEKSKDDYSRNCQMFKSCFVSPLRFIPQTLLRNLDNF